MRERERERGREEGKVEVGIVVVINPRVLSSLLFAIIHEYCESILFEPFNTIIECIILIS